MQWNLDFSAPSFVNPCDDCAYLASGSGRVLRDGYFGSGLPTLLVSYRNSQYPTNRFQSFGFRCARAP
jgi:formylglycine-generating enzyme required for sulfatase activity